MTWHLDEGLLTAYAAGAADPIRASSAEAHLTSCAACRAALAPRVPRPRLERVWEEVAYRIDAPVPGPVERLLVRCGVAEHQARLLASTPALHLSWLASLVVVLGFAVMAAHTQPRGISMFLAVAPLLPLAGIATAYGPGVDPTYEIGLAAPLHSGRLLLVRAVVVLVVSVGLAGVAALALPGVGWTAAAWVLPALALSLAALALGSMVDPLHAAAGIAVTWAASLLAVVGTGGSVAVLITPGVQVAFAAAAALAVVVVALRRGAYEIALDRKDVA